MDLKYKPQPKGLDKGRGRKRVPIMGVGWHQVDLITTRFLNGIAASLLSVVGATR